MVEMSDEELKALTSAIKIRYGYDFTNYESKSLKRGFARLIAKHQLGSLLGLWSKVLKDKEFMLSCMDDLTVNLTEMFRNPEVWVKLKDEVEEYGRLKSKLKFWHAGCSTGEEIYTMAIILNDIKYLHKARTLGTDLSDTALAQAVEGKYSSLIWKKYERSFQKYFPNGKIEDYFRISDDYAIMQDRLKAHVEFKKHNLVKDPMNEKFDFIFCRNVMIYFDNTLKMSVLKLFHDSLEDDGYFVIGYYDMMPEESKSLFTLHDATTRVYKKVKKTDAKPEESGSEVLNRLRNMLYGENGLETEQKQTV